MSERDVAHGRIAQATVTPRQSSAASSGGQDVRLLSRPGDWSAIAAHAAVIGREGRGQAGLHRSLLQLQHRYGNHHVGQVLRRAGAIGPDGSATEAIERAIGEARGGGQSMDHATQSRMAAAFGVDFSGVRIHADSRADMLSQSLNARAFTTGQDVFFRQGEYNPGAAAGRELLAHELTHVVQQGGGVGLQRRMTVSEPGDEHEVEADRVAQTVLSTEINGAGGGTRSDEQRRLERSHASLGGLGQYPVDEHLLGRDDEDQHSSSQIPTSRDWDKEKSEDNDYQVSALRSASGSGHMQKLVSRKAETHALPNWGSSYFNKSNMTLNPFARLVVDGKVVRDDWGISGTQPAAFTVPQCAKFGELQLTVHGYWFQNNSFGNISGDGTAIIISPFELNKKGEIQFKPSILNAEARGEAAQMTAVPSVASTSPFSGTLTAQIAINATDQKGVELSVPVAGGLAYSGTITSSNSFVRTYRVELVVDRKAGIPVSRTLPVYFDIGKHRVIGGGEPIQPVNIREIHSFLESLPKDVKAELDSGMGDKKAAIEVLARASTTKPHNAAAGFNVALSEKRRDAVVRLIQNILGAGAKIKARAIGELEAADPGESDYERAATVTVTWEDDACDAGPTRPPGSQ